MLPLTMLVARADTIKLFNGRTINGKVISTTDAPKYKVPDGYTRIQFKNNGWLLVRTGQVASVELNNLDDFDKK